MDIMERLEIPIPEDEWDRILTPAGLVELFQSVG
jgi:acyl carrier protein